MTYKRNKYGGWKGLANSLCREAGFLDPGFGFSENVASPRGFYAFEDLDIHVIYENRPTYAAGIAETLKKILKAEKIKVLAYSEADSNWVMLVDIPANMGQRCRDIHITAIKAVTGQDAIVRDYNHNTEEQ